MACEGTDEQVTPCDEIYYNGVCARNDLVEECWIGEMIANDLGVATGKCVCVCVCV